MPDSSAQASEVARLKAQLAEQTTVRLSLIIKLDIRPTITYLLTTLLLSY
jgi:hypothetical protein